MSGMNITSVQFGLYRDGDNNLDVVQSPVIDQAFDASEHDKLVAFTVEDTTARRDFTGARGARTESYAIRDGQLDGEVAIDRPHDPSSRANLAAFVARTLDDAERNGAKQTWLDLVDHGGGDGGGLESDTHRAIMSSTDMAGAIADGIAQHAKEHPGDAGRTIDGVVANQCAMSTTPSRKAPSRVDNGTLPAMMPADRSFRCARRLNRRSALVRLITRGIAHSRHRQRRSSSR